MVVTTDIIVGFQEKLRKIFSSYITIIKRRAPDMAYGQHSLKRSGTPAATMDDQITEEIKRKFGYKTLMDVHK